MAKHKIAIYKNPDTEETEVYFSASLVEVYKSVEVSVIEDDAFGELVAFDAAVCTWKEITAKLRKALNRED